MFDLIVRNGTVVTEAGMRQVDLGVRKGRIAAILARDPRSTHDATEEFDADSLYILPGVVDPHTHIGLGSENDWETETASAARGGVTTVFNYVMGSESFNVLVPKEHEAAASRTHVDYSLHLVPCTEQHLAELEEYMDELHVNSFKYFMSFRGDEGKYLGIEGTDDGFLYEYLTKVGARTGAVANIHAENIEIVWRLRAAAQERGDDGLSAWNESRPNFVEAESVAKAAHFARLTGATMYIVHMSAKESIVEAVRARQVAETDGGPPLYLETCAHYLTHTDDSSVGMLGKVNPPLRRPDDSEALWQALADGVIDTIGSDHSGRRRELKVGSVWKSPAGIAGIGAQLTVLLSEGVNKRGLALERVAALMSTNPARIFGIYPKKGTIAIGSDADLVFVDLDEERRVEPYSWGGNPGYNLYEGQTLKGWPVATLLRGTFTFREGEIVSERGVGAFLPRPLEALSVMDSRITTDSEDHVDA